MIYFTSDLHFGHANVIKYCNRPFDNVEDMNRGLINNWNERVSHDDEVYVLGDFSFDDPEKFAPHLNGRKYLIIGNHDNRRKLDKLKNHFEWVRDMFTLKLGKLRKGGKEIVMCHYAMRVWDKAHHGSWHLHGHSHGSLDEIEWGKSIDVGVDSKFTNYRPISIDEVSKIMESRNMVSHH